VLVAPPEPVAGRPFFCLTAGNSPARYPEISAMNVDERIRQRAYEIWEAEGRPEGQEADHWQRARDEIEPFYKEGNAEAGGIESSVAIPMPKSGGDR